MQGRKEIDVSAVFDLETEKWDRFVAGGIEEASGKYVEHTDETAMVNHLLSIEGTVWAHNGGRFDLLWLCDHLAARGLAAQVSLAGSRIVNLKVGKTQFRDSFALIPLALKDAARIGGNEKSDTGLPCSCDLECGGFCSIRRVGMSLRDRMALSEYLRQDCKALQATLSRLRGFAEENDLDLTGTIGSASWSTIQRWLDVGDAEWPSARLYTQCRKAYFGGRVQVFQPYAEAGFRYDINSAYPAALVETPIPFGARHVLTTAREASDAFYRGREGIFRAQVKVPTSEFLPVLPMRSKDRITYPIGAHVGTWTALELREAMEQGHQVEILSGIIWARSDTLLGPFCEKIWSIRHKLGKSSPLGKWLKWFANAPTGKLAQRPESERVKFLGDHEDRPKLCHASYDCSNSGCGFDCCPHRCTRRCGGWRPLDKHGVVWRRNVYRLPSSGYIHWAAYLTGATRVKTARQLRANDSGASAVYCDTDSCYATVRRAGTSQELGGWLDEGAFKNFLALAPKVYRFEGDEGGETVRAKGIPEAEKHWAELKSGAAVKIDRGVASFLQSAPGDKFFNRRNFSRALKNNGGMFGDRRLGVDGKTYPLPASHWRK